MPKKKRRKKPNQLRQEWRDRWPVIRFTSSFLLATILFFVVTNAEWFYQARLPLLKLYAELSSFFLNIFGYATQTRVDVISSSSFSVNIKEGCDAVAPSILFAVAVLVFPVKWKYRWRGLVVGLLTIFILNIVRIVTLFLTGVHAMSYFEFMHVEFWQAVFIVLTIMIWLSWLRWATHKEQSHATAQ